MSLWPRRLLYAGCTASHQLKQLKVTIVMLACMPHAETSRLAIWAKNGVPCARPFWSPAPLCRTTHQLTSVTDGGMQRQTVQPSIVMATSVIRLMQAESAEVLDSLGCLR